MRKRDYFISAICLVTAVALLFAAGSQLDYINVQREKMDIVINEPLENAPPSLAFATVAMGAFRGLVVDILYIRAAKLKDQGQFFDAKQLAEWITVMQPRFAGVWEFQAWNMAYNISVAIPATEPEQRWQWVRNGYELLRDKGIPLNPKAILLYRELARIFQHKIAGISDDAHKYYKLRLAHAMTPLVGPATRGYYRALAEAPNSWKGVLEYANIKQLVEDLSKADPAFAEQQNFVRNYLALRNNPDRFSDKAFQVIDGYRGTQELERFDIFARAYQLRNVWKLEPEIMHEINLKYGPIDPEDPNRHLPLDWRHPDSHAIYWAIKGLKVAGEEEFSAEEANTDRIVNHSLQNLFRNGNIYIYKTRVNSEDGNDMLREQIFLRPDFRMFEPYNNAIMARIEKYKQFEDFNPGTYRSMQIGHRNMLKDAVINLYQTGHQNLAGRIYKQLRQLYPRKENSVSIVAYVRKSMAQELQYLDINDAKQMVIALLRESYFLYAMRDDDAAYAREQMAQQVLKHFEEQYRDPELIEMPDLKMLRYFALQDFLMDWQYPPELRKSLLDRIKIERPKLHQQLMEKEKQFIQQLQEQKQQQSQSQ